MFHLITGLIGLYVSWRYVWPLPCGLVQRVVMSVVILLMAEHHLITRTFFGTMASPEVPQGVLILLGWGFGAVLLAAVLMLVHDVVGGIGFIVSRPVAQTLFTAAWPRNGLAVLAMLLAAVGVWSAVRVPEVKTIEITLPRLPQALDGFRLVQLTDLHASRLLEAPWIAAVVEKTNALDADLIVISGDLVDGTVTARAADVAPLTQLRAKHGVHAIAGNHEYYVDYRHWLKAFEQMGLPLMNNTHTTIRHNGAELVLAGVTDSAAERFQLPLPDIDAALAGADRSNVIILLEHRPKGAAVNARAGVDLQLSGHTHGGQVLGMHLLTQLVNGGYVSGGYQVDAMQLYVSNGTGLWSGFPVRLGRPSEITEIILRSAQEAGR